MFQLQDVSTTAPRAAIELMSFFVTSFEELTIIKLLSRGFRDVWCPKIRLLLLDPTESNEEEHVIREHFTYCHDSVLIKRNCHGMAHRLLAAMPQAIASRVTHLAMSCMEKCIGNQVVPYFPDNHTAFEFRGDDYQCLLLRPHGGLVLVDELYPTVRYGQSFTGLQYLYLHHCAQGYCGSYCRQLLYSSACFLMNMPASLEHLEIVDKATYRLTKMDKPPAFLFEHVLGRIGHQLLHLRLQNIPSWNIGRDSDYPPEDIQRLLRQKVDKYCTALALPASIETWFDKIRDKRKYKAAIAAQAAVNAGGDRFAVYFAVHYAVCLVGQRMGEYQNANPKLYSAALAEVRAAMLREFPDDPFPHCMADLDGPAGRCQVRVF